MSEMNGENTNNTSSNISNTNISPEMVSEQVILMRMKLEELREKKKSLESENENLGCKINDLRLIMERISKENDE
jgi:FtsZ-binding cell division protein ZapB